MRLIKLMVPATLVAAIGLFAPHAGAQTMGEYATTTAGVGSGASSMGAAIANTVSSDDIGGGSTTWGASSVGASFEERAGAASSSGAGSDFESRAGAMTSGSTAGSRWPATSQLDSGDSSSRFGDSSGADSGRFPQTDRFNQTSQLDSSDRFPPSAFNDNQNGLDTGYSHSGLDSSGSSGGLDNSYSAGGLSQ
jgi:hypothetical protein